MLEVLVGFENRARELRSRLFGSADQGPDRHFAIAVIVLVIGLGTPLLPITIAPMSAVAGLLLLVGAVLILSVVFAPVGLLLI